jgi:hypothetical protein
LEEAPDPIKAAQTAEDKEFLAAEEERKREEEIAKVKKEIEERVRREEAAKTGARPLSMPGFGVYNRWHPSVQAGTATN